MELLNKSSDVSIYTTGFWLVLLSLCPLQPLTHDQRDKWPAVGRLMDKGDCVWGAGRPSAGAISQPIVGLSGALGSS